MDLNYYVALTVLKQKALSDKNKDALLRGKVEKLGGVQARSPEAESAHGTGGQLGHKARSL